jgi:DNA transposition AAA+ family ATPase
LFFKLIVLYGFAASGKTTLSKLFIDKHPLTISIEGDKIIDMIGQWESDEPTARKLVFEDAKLIAENHLTSGFDVLIPYFLTDSAEA